MSFDLKSIVDEVVLDEMTTTGNVEGYNTPFAFTSGRKKDKKKNKRISTNSTGYKVVKESVDNRDFKVISVVGIGAIIGLLSFSRVLKWLFTNYKNFFGVEILDSFYEVLVHCY